jgi:tetratricopeptide (TPR) repeat protein
LAADIGNICLKLERWEEARASFEKIVASGAYLLLGCALHEPETLSEAIAAYEKSLDLKPGRLEALSNLADAYLQLDRVEEAKDVLAQARKARSDDSKLHYSLAELYLKAGMRSEAHREHKILRQIDPPVADMLAKLLNGEPNS